MARRPAGDVTDHERRDWPELRASSTVLTCVSLCQFLELAARHVPSNFREDMRCSSSTRLICHYRCRCHWQRQRRRRPRPRRRHLRCCWLIVANHSFAPLRFVPYRAFTPSTIFTCRPRASLVENASAIARHRRHPLSRFRLPRYTWLSNRRIES